MIEKYFNSPKIIFYDYFLRDRLILLLFLMLKNEQWNTYHNLQVSPDKQLKSNNKSPDVSLYNAIIG